MKLSKNIFINDKPYQVVKEEIALDVSTPGRAIFTVASEEKLSGMVHFEIGVAGRGVMVDFFTGFIERCTTVDAKQQKLFCREFTAVLWPVIPVSIRRCSMVDVLNIYSRKTGLQFALPGAEYTRTVKPLFQTAGTGIHGLDSLGAVFGIKNYIWQQQADGKVFAGDWNDSRWSGNDFPVDERFFQDVQPDGTKTLQVIPGLRPGVKMNGEFINSLQLKEHFMVVTCGKELGL